MPLLIAKRLLGALPNLFGIVLITFLLTRALPGDPAAFFAGPAGTQEAVEQVREKLGLNRPLWEQFLAYLGDIARLDLGRSMVTGRPVMEDLQHALPFTLELTTASILFGVLTGVPIGVWSALRCNGLADYVTRAFSLMGLSFPPFFLGICLLLLLAILFPIFPVVSADQARPSHFAM